MYRFRGVVEGLFGGMKTWLGGPTFGEALDGHGAGVFGAHRLRP
ncbi:hypothetical protein TO73_2412 [Thermus aquaticus Y51MC23]|uniref:Transposase DDE domain-containing protein n=1 Tax=Thermus aquaticus (strain ATCC BAA-2747 / Y51MC23) TaxID=498848 RepID=A0ABM5VP45_THEA5|nr:hypothetical protein TO73_2412 [Thermus aquaticus Y51MC23]